MGSMFGGLDLGSPEERNALIVIRELELRREREPESGWGRVYRNGADLLLTHGELFAGRPVPEKYAALVTTPGTCFWVATSCAEQYGIRYFEGIASAGGGRYLAHGWAVDDDGVIDLSWALANMNADTEMLAVPREQWTYFGVEIHPELMRAHEEIGFPMLGRDAIERSRRMADEWTTRSGLDMTPPAELPLLDYPYKPDRREFA